MDKEKILEQIRESNEYEGDPYEKEITQKSWYVGSGCSLGVSVLLYFLEWFFWGANNIAILAPAVTMMAVTSLLQVIRFRSIYNIVSTVVFGALFVLLAAFCILDYGFGWRMI